MESLVLFFSVPGFVVAALASAWKGWRGALGTAGLTIALYAALVITALATEPRPHTRAGAFGTGQTIAYGLGFLCFALLGEAPGAIIGLVSRRLALRGRQPVLEVDSSN